MILRMYDVKEPVPVRREGKAGCFECFGFFAATVIDAASSVIPLGEPNPLAFECHTALAHPGATANDICAGAVAVTSPAT
jgi:hypothetical protein